MKKSHSTAILLAWIRVFIATAEGECGWREVERGKRINFNWDSHTLEVKTEEISSDNIEDKQLEIEFDTEKQTMQKVLKFWNFHLTQSDHYGVEAETLNFDIIFKEESLETSTRKPPGELQWTFKKNNFLNMMQVALAGTYLQENLVLTNEDETEMFRFSSGDNISLLYRVNSTDEDENCVETGSNNSRDTI